MAPARRRTRVRWRTWLQYAVPVVVFAVLAVRFGPAPFLDAFRTANPWMFPAAAGVAVGTTACCVVRWRIISAALGLPLSFREAMAAYYRSQFLNATLPGGVLGDVDRGWGQYRGGRPLGRAARGIAWERMLGQAVQILLTVTVVVIVPSPLRRAFPPGTAAIAGSALAVIAAALLAIYPSSRRLIGRKSCAGSDKSTPMRLQGGTHAVYVHGKRVRSWGRSRHPIAQDWHAIRTTPHALVLTWLTSMMAVLGHAAVFLLAAASVGVGGHWAVLVPTTLAVLVIGALPLNIAGWGPREGAAAWLFGMVGLHAAQGLSVSVLFGVLTLVGVLPGALMLLRPRRARRHD
jgi:uncharacterized protein (TIRG00374 family)